MMHRRSTSTYAKDASKADYDALDSTTQDVLNQHAIELSNNARPHYYTGSGPVTIKRKAHGLHALTHFIRETFSNYLWAVFSAPQTLLTDPVGVVWSLWVLPFLHSCIFIMQVTFLIGGRLGALGMYEKFSKTYGSGLSPVNILDSNLFDDNTAIVVHGAARKGLSNAYGFPDITSMPDPNEQVTPTRYFNLDIAKSFIILCALVYERDDHYVRQASTVAKRHDMAEEPKRQLIAELLARSSTLISRQADKWGMNFSSVSDFVSIGGPFCGLFWPKDSAEKWIVIAFKGTSPTNISEFMVDATIVHHNAQSFYGSGALHQGFYTSLAPGAESNVDPYATILYSLKHVARSLRKEGDPKINLWVTGHSLGAALSSLLFARLLFSPSDLGDDLVLRQGYMYGTPRVADSDFISAFDFAASSPFGDTTQSMWRVINGIDMVTNLPPGLADDEQNRARLPKNSLLNYGHFGTAGIRLTKSKEWPEGWAIESGSLRGGSDVKVVQSQIASNSASSSTTIKPTTQPKTINMWGTSVRIDPIAILKWTSSLVTPVADHMPGAYFAALERVKPDVVS